MPGLCKQKAAGAMEIFGHLFCSPACLSSNPVHHLLWSRDTFSSGQRQNLKRSVLHFPYCVTAFQPLSRSKLRPHPDAADSSSLILRLCHVVYRRLNINSCRAVRSTATVTACFQSHRSGHCWNPEAALYVVKALLVT